MKRIVVATDGSPSAAEASRFGIELAREHDAELVFAHVVPEYDVVPASVLSIGGVFPHELRAYDTALLEDAAALAAEQGVIATTALLRGDTVDAIVEYAGSHGADLIVVGSRGHGPITGALLGSVSLGILRRAGLPVAIVPAGAGAERHPKQGSVVARS